MKHLSIAGFTAGGSALVGLAISCVTLLQQVSTLHKHEAKVRRHDQFEQNRADRESLQADGWHEGYATCEDSLAAMKRQNRRLRWALKQCEEGQ
jgi:hypothetical protein